MTRNLGARLVTAAVAMSLPAFASTGSTADTPSAIPPVVLQDCTAKLRLGERPLFTVSFVNTTDKVAKLVLVRVGETDYAKIGSFAPNVVITWKVGGRAGSDCSIRAVKFTDGTEWDAPPEVAPQASPT